MHEKSIKVDIDFNEALRRIAKTPKSVIDVETKAKISKKVAASLDAATKVKLHQNNES